MNGIKYTTYALRTGFLSVIIIFIMLNGRIHANGLQPELVLAPNNVHALASVFAGNDGGAYYVSEVGKHVYWFAEHPGKKYAHVFKGVRSGDQISGKFWSVPKFSSIKHGTVKLKVQPNGQLRVIQQSGGFPSSRFSVTTINAIKNKLPGRRSPRFTQVGINDLDGVFDTAENERLYVRQRGKTVVFAVESRFSKGQLPKGAFVFVGSRTSNKLKGHLIPVPKGKISAPKLASKRVEIRAEVRPNRTLRMTKDFKIASNKGFFGSKSIVPVLPDIRIPIKHALKILELFEDNLVIKLDGYDKNGNGLRDGGLITLFGQPQRPFNISRHTINPKRWTYLNDVVSENVDFDALDGNKGRLEIRFEQGGRELKRYCGSCCIRKFHGKDGQLCDNNMKDWNMDNLRVTVMLKLVNFNGGISYHATSFKWHGTLEDTPHIDSVENWIDKKLRRSVESVGLDSLNNSTTKQNVKQAIDNALKNIPAYLQRYSKSPYNLSGITPKRVLVDGNDIVFRFRT